VATPRRLVFSQDTGTTSVKIHAEINSNGDLLLRGHDLSHAPGAAAGERDFEYTLRVPAEHRERLLLDLVAHAFGTANAAADFKAWLKERGVPHAFETW